MRKPTRKSAVLQVLGPLGVVLAVGCATAAPTGPVNIGKDTATDQGGAAEIDISYEPAGDDQVRLIFKLRGVGIEEMDKVALNVDLGDFILVDGVAQWSGYVPPRQTQRHEMVVKVRQATDTATLSYTLVRFQDSQPLAGRDLTFAVSNGKVTPKK